MAAAAGEKLVNLISQEGESFEVRVEVAMMSELVKTMIDGTLRAPFIVFCVLPCTDSLWVHDFSRMFFHLDSPSRQ